LMEFPTPELARLAAYLTLPPVYRERLGGLQWSTLAKQFLYPNGRSAIDYDVLAEFVEGFASQRDLIAFPSLLHWALLANPHSELKPFRQEHLRLRDALRGNERLWRNVGALVGWLSRDFPTAIDPPSTSQLCNGLRDDRLLSPFAARLNGVGCTAVEPAVGFNDFYERASKALAELSDEELDHWLRFGRGRLTDAGRKLAEETPQPRGVGQIIEALLQRPRLAGAAPYVPQMVAALSVPMPRKRERSLPVGGFSDVMTRGTPDRLLPSQHALDEIDFLRRYSENELLYFQREDPPSQPKRDLAIILDQGVRTWGDVRLVLAAAVLALAKNAANAGKRCSVFFTSRPLGFEDPLIEPDPAFAEAMEASDLTRDPGTTLETVLQQEQIVPCDIFLLTHPRNLNEEDVGIAARRLAGDCRLFALAVDGRGEAEVAEFRRGRPLRLRSFRVEFVAAKAPVPPPTPSHARAYGWTGDVERVGWPFRLAPDGPLRAFDFDDLSERIFALSGSCMLHMWTIADGECELLPLPKIAADWKDLVGLRGGFALIGSHEGRVAIAHYDLHRRSCKTYTSERVWSDLLRPRYSASQHSLALMRARGSAVVLCIDLQNEAMSEAAQASPSAVEVTGSAAFADSGLQLIRIPMLSDLPFVSAAPMYCYEEATGKLHVLENDRRTINMEHRSNGLTLPQRGFRFEKAELKGNVIALVGTIAGFREVIAFDLPSGHYLRSMMIGPADDSAYRISNRGESIAARSGDNFNVSAFGLQSSQRLHARSARSAKPVRLWAGDRSFLIVCGSRSQVAHLVVWSDRALRVITEVSPVSIRELDIARFRHPRLKEFILREDPVEAKESNRIKLYADDDRRWKTHVRRGTADILIDRFGQTVVIDGGGNLVFMMLAFGDSWTAWLPDGTRHGVGTIHHWPNSKEALETMRNALVRAFDGEWK
jgi:hypothetical protein